jgi:hypothetical protein
MPLGDGVSFVSLAGPGVNLVDNCLFVGDAAVETLRGEDAELDSAKSSQEPCLGV